MMHNSFTAFTVIVVQPIFSMAHVWNYLLQSLCNMQSYRLMSVPCSVLTTDVFLCWQAWLWPMWTPACLPTRPPLLLSVSESTYWTWFPPVQSPRQPTHGNDAFLLPTDTITITLPHINNSHSHYHASPFYGLFACGQNGAGGNQPHFLWAGDVPPLLS